MNFSFCLSNVDHSVPNIAGNNSPLTPLLPMERSSFDFSPSAIARCLNQSNATPKCMKPMKTAMSSHRSFTPLLSAKELSFCNISPIEGSLETDDDSRNKVPVNSPATARMQDERVVATGNLSRRHVSFIGSKTTGATDFSSNAMYIRVLDECGSTISMERRLCVETILKDHGLVHLVDTFVREEIDLALFFTMTECDLKTIGISDVDRLIILNAIAEYS